MNGKQVLVSQMKTEEVDTIDDITYQSEKVPKTSNIKLEIWVNYINIFWTNEKLIFQSEGDIESFLTQPFRKDNQTSTVINTIETISFWRDEYE